MWARLIRQNNLKIDSLIYASNIDNKKIFIINEKSCLLNYLKISIKIWIFNNYYYLVRELRKTYEHVIFNKKIKKKFNPDWLKSLLKGNNIIFMLTK